MQKLNFKKNIGIATLIFFSIYSIFYYNLVSSGSNDNVSGYAWSGDWVDVNINGSQNPPEETEGGVGWISFNCLKEAGTCGIAENYGVNINPTTFDVTGYAWSNNFGWIKFGGLSGFPTGNNTVSSNAKFVGTYNAGVFNGYLTGWARFCSAASNPDSCLGTLTSDKNGGWDGWISLKGQNTSNQNYGVTVTNNIFGGYAFGGNNGTNPVTGTAWNNNSVGWISFAGTNYDVRVTANATVLDFYASPSPTFAPNFTTTLTWKSLNPNITFNSCVLSGGTTGTYTSPAIPNSKPNVAVATNPTSFTLTCTDSSSNQYVSTISVPRLQEEKLTLRNSTVQGGLTTLSWTSVGLNTCTASTVNPSSVPSWTGIKDPSGSTPNVQVNAVLPAKTTYTLSCIGDYSGLSVSASLDLHTGSASSSQVKVPTYKEN